MKYVWADWASENEIRPRPRRNDQQGQRKQTRKRKRLRKGVILWLLVIIAAAVYMNGSGVIGNTADFLHMFSGGAGGGEWNLVLVNKQHPLRMDEDDIQLTELANGERVDTRMYPYLQEMFDDARSEGVYPVVNSGFRSKEEQQRVYDDKMAAYKAEGLSRREAKRETELWVNVPGTSEHQLGLAVDINAKGKNDGDQVYQWLHDNAYRYGFIKRYPSDKTDITGVANEPWHYRYVGREVAAKIHEQGICLEEYLDQ